MVCSTSRGCPRFRLPKCVESCVFHPTPQARELPLPSAVEHLLLACCVALLEKEREREIFHTLSRYLVCSRQVRPFRAHERLGLSAYRGDGSNSLALFFGLLSPKPRGVSPQNRTFFSCSVVLCRRKLHPPTGTHTCLKNSVSCASIGSSS